MRILELRANNFARLHAVEIRPDGKIVPIVGKNDAGKSTVLRAIWAVLEGKTAAPKKAIREGADEAALQVEIGTEKVELTVQRTIKRHKTTGEEVWDLKVTQAGKGRITRKPQELIDGFLDALAFDPLVFARSKPAEQVAQLKALAPGFDFDAAAGRRQALFEERTTANRTNRDQAAIAASIELPPGPKPKPIDAAETMRRLNAANAHNDAIARDVVEKNRTERAGNDELDRAERLRAEAETAERHGKELLERAKNIEIAPALDTMPLQNALTGAQDRLKVIAKFEQRDAAGTAAQAAATEAERLSREIEAIDASVRKAVEDARLPAGLAMTEDGVLLNGLPFEDAAMSQKIIASAEVRMAISPDLRVMLIDQGSELDSDTLALLAKLAEKRDYQVWVARVSEGGAPGFTIEDGRVAAHREAAE